MEINGLFQIGPNVYRALSNADGLSCRDCAAVDKDALCSKMPECKTMVFKKLSDVELRHAKKNRLPIEQL